VLAFVLTLPAPAQPDYPTRFDGTRTAAAILRGTGIRSDFAADYVGARALLHGDDPYPVLGTAFAAVGIDWNVPNRSTHPPTAEALALPVAGLSWPVASAIWGWLMVAALAASAWAFGLRWRWAVAVGALALLWPPAAWSIGQLTPLWLLGAALAWRWRDRPLAAGAAIGLAASTKLLPALLLLPFLLRRRWTAAAGAAAAVAVVLLPALALAPDAVSRWLDVQRSEGNNQTRRSDNAALLAAAWHHTHAAGVAAALVLVFLVVAWAVYRGLDDDGSDFAAFAAWLWLSVALLPAAWIYSLLPLAPLLLVALRPSRPLAAAAALAAVVLSISSLPFRVESAVPLAVATALAGLAALSVGFDVLGREQHRGHLFFRRVLVQDGDVDKGREHGGDRH
jgi:hypothetical protein